jgi:hypothetical protein
VKYREIHPASVHASMLAHFVFPRNSGISDSDLERAYSVRRVNRRKMCH